MAARRRALFFEAAAGRPLGLKRSLDRARRLAAQLGLNPLALPVCTVVGSKGKGSAATAAAAFLECAGLQVVLVTSPPFRTNLERIRRSGRALSEAEYDRLGEVLADGLSHLPPMEEGYLSPTGAYTLMGGRWAQEAGADVLVAEEGMGGTSDEVSLWHPVVVAVTPVFEEHLGILGDNLSDIVADELGVVCSRTAAVVTGRQRNALVEQAIAERARCVGARVVASREMLPGVAARWVPLVAANVMTGFSAANEFLGEMGSRVDFAAVGEQAAARLRLPGRHSVHQQLGSTWVVDAAIDPVGVAASLAACRAKAGEPDLVLACFPDGKDVQGCAAVLDGLPVVWVREGTGHLKFSMLPEPSLLGRQALELAMGRAPSLLLCVGTISWIAVVLDFLDVSLERLY